MKTLQFLVASLACAFVPVANAQQLLIPDATNKRVMLFDAGDGSLIDANFIDLSSSTGSTAVAPIETAVAPNGDILVCDQIASTIFRYSPNGSTYLGESNATLGGVSGMEVALGSIWVTNTSSAGGAPGSALVELDTNLNVVSTQLLVGSPADVQAITRLGVLNFLITDTINDVLWLYDPSSGLSPSVFHNSDAVNGFDHPQQVTVMASTGHILVAGVQIPSGIFMHNSTNGSPMGAIFTDALAGVSGLRGIHELGDGNFLFTNPGGVYLFNRSNNTISTVHSGVDARYISEYSLPAEISTFCGPGNNNSTGTPVTLTGNFNSGTLHLDASGGPMNQLGYVLVGTGTNTASPINLGDGLLCLTTVVGRYNVAGTARNSVGGFNAAGQFINFAGTSTTGAGFDVPSILPIPGSPTIGAGQTYHFQMWYRDTPAGAGHSNLSNGITANF